MEKNYDAKSSYDEYLTPEKSQERGENNFKYFR